MLAENVVEGEYTFLILDHATEANFITRMAPGVGTNAGVEMFSNNKEFLEFISLLIKKLEVIGENEWGGEFHKAMLISNIPGEYFGALRNTLEKFSATVIPERLELRKEIDTALELLNNILI